MAGRLPRESPVLLEVLLEIDKTLIRDGSAKGRRSRQKTGVSGGSVVALLILRCTSRTSIRITVTLIEM